MKALASALTAVLGDSAGAQKILAARAQVQRYETPDYVDLVDLCSLLASSGAGPEIVTACNNATAAAQNYVIAEGYKGAALRNSHGVSIYFPVGEAYARLGFQQEDRVEQVSKSIRQRSAPSVSWRIVLLEGQLESNSKGLNWSNALSHGHPPDRSSRSGQCHGSAPVSLRYDRF